ncbi:Cobalt/zinc/cadmium efflux RND transporter, membrane fusion protein, CzcB family [hydrothermal vent metagenome]|uniref:Cobalt/zinc/cadmium efflux RND transporter, membrane fusion protein, CzcB family n=1 Tax=hydrothermal vent metagenome TaxID=652676 RepID=A0A3B0S6F6_9ZZZZ
MNNRKLILIAGLVIILTAIAGIFVGRSMSGGIEPVASEEAGEDDHGDEEGLVRLTDEQLKTSNIEIFEVVPGSLDEEIIAQGSVTPSPQGQAILSAGAEGRVTRIRKRLGDPVRRGETIATIESREAATISSEVTAAASRAGLARSQLAREKRLYDEKITARADLEAARAEHQQAAAEAGRARQAASASGVSGRYIAVRSPISGQVISAPAILGSYVTAQDELFRIANPGLIQVEAAVPAEDAHKISAGDSASVESHGVTISARVLAVTPAADPENRAAIAVLAPAAGSSLVPGEYVRVRISHNAGDNGSSAITVPAEAVQTVEGRSVVFIRTKAGFRARPVTTGAKSGGRVEIIRGISVGSKIAGKNAFLLKSELGRGEAEH